MDIKLTTTTTERKTAQKQGHVEFQHSELCYADVTVRTDSKSGPTAGSRMFKGLRRKYTDSFPCCKAQSGSGQGKKDVIANTLVILSQYTDDQELLNLML